MLVLVGFGWLWLVLVGFGWFWLALVGFGWLLGDVINHYHNCIKGLTSYDISRDEYDHTSHHQ